MNISLWKCKNFIFLIVWIIKRKIEYIIFNNKNIIKSNISILWNLINDKTNWDYKYDIKLNGYIYLKIKVIFFYWAICVHVGHAREARETTHTITTPGFGGAKV